MPLVIRNVASEEFGLAGEIVVEAYRTLGDRGDEFYERELRDVAGRVDSSEVLVAEDDGRVVGCVTFVDGLREQQPDVFGHAVHRLRCTGRQLAERHVYRLEPSRVVVPDEPVQLGLASTFSPYPRRTNYV